MVCGFVDENFQKSSFFSHDPPIIPRITWVPEPLRNVPPLFKKTLLPDHFCEMLWSDERNGLKMAVLELGVHTFFQMVIPSIYDS